jgi:hypothetical protein
LNCFYLFQNVPELEFLEDLEEFLQLDDEASEMLAYKAVFELDKILEQI